jgi:hypothetical protein
MILTDWSPSKRCVIPGILAELRNFGYQFLAECEESTPRPGQAIERHRARSLSTKVAEDQRYGFEIHFTTHRVYVHTTERREIQTPKRYDFEIHFTTQRVYVCHFGPERLGKMGGLYNT